MLFKLLVAADQDKSGMSVGSFAGQSWTHHSCLLLVLHPGTTHEIWLYGENKHEPRCAINSTRKQRKSNIPRQHFFFLLFSSLGKEGKNNVDCRLPHLPSKVNTTRRLPSLGKSRRNSRVYNHFLLPHHHVKTRVRYVYC